MLNLLGVHLRPRRRRIQFHSPGATPRKLGLNTRLNMAPFCVVGPTAPARVKLVSLEAGNVRLPEVADLRGQMNEEEGLSVEAGMDHERSRGGVSRRRFLGWAVAAASLMSLRSSAQTGDKGVPPRRLERLAPGANVCRWFRFPRQTTAEHFADYIRESEAECMARVGLRHVRLCVAPAVILDVREGRPRPEILPHLEQAIRRFHRVGLAVVVDLHNEDRQAELDPAWQDAFVRFWGELARRLNAFDPDLTFLEFINEPVFQGREEEWNQLNARLATAIRRNAPGHTFITSGPNWGGIRGLRRLKLLEDRNVVYSFHFYEPFPFTHQGATWSSEEVKPLRQVPYPSSPEAVAPLLEGLKDHPGARAMLERYGEQRWNAERLAAEFQQAVSWGQSHGVPLYCGEFGVFPRHARPEHRAQWFRDVGQILARHKVGWAVWGWDEGFGLARQWVNGRPVVDETVARALGLQPC